MYKFLIFDIKDYFSSSVQKELLNKGLRIAEENIDIFGNDREIIHHARKSLFFWWKGHMYEKAEWFDCRHNGSLRQCRSMWTSIIKV